MLIRVVPYERKGRESADGFAGIAGFFREVRNRHWQRLREQGPKTAFGGLLLGCPGVVVILLRFSNTTD
jgi:hypothetical protein